MKLPRGHTLVEVVIAILMVGIIAVSIFSAAITSRLGAVKADQRTAAALAAQRVLETLKVFVTADAGSSPGPGAAPNGWGLPGDSCGCYALSAGTHVLDPALWLSQLAAPPLNGRISYTVLLTRTLHGEQPTVTLDIRWTDL